jgi:predicted component of type VI protein secretion system
VSRPVIEFRTDERLHLGEFGIQARLVRPEGESAKQADHGHTMVYSTSDRAQESLTEARADRAGRAILQAEGRRLVIGPGGAVVGRSRECDVVLGDSNVSRRHAEIRPGAGGQWTVADLGSTNGVQVNGRRITGATPLKAGDHLVFGTVDAVFEVE